MESHAVQDHAVDAAERGPRTADLFISFTSRDGDWKTLPAAHADSHRGDHRSQLYRGICAAAR
jgi:hypothetical protein